MEGKVIPIRPIFALFNDDLRKKLEDSVNGFTTKPGETISSIEQVICTHLISVVRKVSVSIGQKIGRRIAGRMVAGADAIQAKVSTLQG